MANLETLELTIAANSESATQGIGHLIRSLSALSAAVGKSVSGLMKLNAELKTLKGYGALKLPTAGSAKASARAVRKGAGEYDPAHNNGRGVDVSQLKFPNAKSPEEWNREFKGNADRYMAQREAQRQNNIKYRQRIKEEAIAAARSAEEQKKAFQQMIQAEKQAMNVRGEETRDIMEQSTKLDLLMMKQEALRMETISMAKEGKLTAKQIADRSIQYQKLSEDIQKTKDKMAETSGETGKLAAGATASAKVMKASFAGVAKSAGGLLSTIGRIFKTMLIRQAIRTLLKGAKEGLDNYYKYAKQAGLSFGSAMDQISSKWSQLKNQMGATLGQALSAVLPILNAIASAALVAFNALSALFALLTGKSSYSKANEVMSEYGDSINKAGGAAKEWLATFDELNVMTQGGGGGGGGASGLDLFSETDLPYWMYEWKPIIEAVLAGVLGATVLPKIWDWIKKILGLFGDSTAKTALDLVGKLTGASDFKIDGLGEAATEMATFGAGAAAAAVAMPVIKEATEKLVEALDGVSMLGSLLGLVGAILTKALASVPVPIVPNTKEYDEFKENHEKWLKVIDRKNVRVVYDDDPAFVTRLNLWLMKKDEKLIDIKYDNDIAFVTKLNKWLNKNDTKQIDVRYDDDVAFVTKLNTWIAQNDTKTIYVKILYSLTSLLTMAALQAWVAKKDTKEILVKVNYGIDSLLQMSILQKWTDKTDTKNIAMSIKYASESLKMNEIDTWAEKKPTKNISIVVLKNAINEIDAWVKATPTKYVNVKLNNDGSSNNSHITGNFIDDFMNAPFLEVIDEYIVKPVDMWLNPKVEPSAKTEVRNDLTEASSNIPATAALSNESRTGIHNSAVTALSNITVDAKANVTGTLTNGTELKNALKNAMKVSGLNIKLNVDNSVKNIGNISIAASGGLFNSADMFVANEDGTAEMIGRFGNQTGVANQREIVAGISKGVADANAEQNELLRQQNSILRSILQKDSSVRLSASSALGRTVSQSLQMYGMATGV